MVIITNDFVVSGPLWVHQTFRHVRSENVDLEVTIMKKRNKISRDVLQPDSFSQTTKNMNISVFNEFGTVLPHLSSLRCYVLLSLKIYPDGNLIHNSLIFVPS